MTTKVEPMMPPEAEVELLPLDKGRVAVYVRNAGRVIASGELSTRTLRQLVAASEAPTAVEKVLAFAHDEARRLLNGSGPADASEILGNAPIEATAPFPLTESGKRTNA